MKVDARFGYHYGKQRTANPADVAEVWYVAEEGLYASLLPEMPGARLVASASPLPRAEERELARLQRTAAAALRAAGHDDLVKQLDGLFVDLAVRAQVGEARVPGLSGQQLELIAALNWRVAESGSCRCSIVAFPAAEAPELPSSLG